MFAPRKALTRLAGVSAAGAMILVALALTASSATASFPGVNGKIAFSRCEDGYSCQVSKIWTVNPDGSGQARLLADPGYWDNDLSYSADGHKLVFQRCTEKTYACGIATVDAHGSGLRQLTPLADPSVDDVPSFSRDGSRIVFNRHAPGAQNWHIWVMSSDGSKPHALTGGSSNDLNPEFSPNGTTIAFSRIVSGAAHIWLMNADGSNQRSVTNAPSRADYQPSFSPDGSRLVFNGCVTGGGCAVWTAAVDGSGAHQVTTPPTSDSEPEFSPDGKQVVFERQLPDFTTRLFTQALSGGPAIQLTSDYDYYVSWAKVPTPSIDSLPTIAGVARAGHALTAKAGPGSWGGAASFQWLRCAGACSVIPGATAATYKPTNADIGARLQVRQTQTSAGGSVSAVSTATAAVVAEPGASLASLVRTGKGRLLARLACPTTQSVVCNGRLTLTVRAHGRSVKLAAGKYQLRAGTAARLTLRAGKSLAKTKTATARLVTRDDAGNMTKATRKLTIKRR